MIAAVVVMVVRTVATREDAIMTPKTTESSIPWMEVVVVIVTEEVEMAEAVDAVEEVVMTAVVVANGNATMMVVMEDMTRVTGTKMMIMVTAAMTMSITIKEEVAMGVEAVEEGALVEGVGEEAEAVEEATKEVKLMMAQKPLAEMMPPPEISRKEPMVVVPMPLGTLLPWSKPTLEAVAMVAEATLVDVAFTEEEASQPVADAAEEELLP